MAGRSFTTSQRKARAERILAAAERGEATSVIAEREGISVRQARRIVAARAMPANDAPVDLTAVDVLEVDGFAELGRCIAAHRESIERLRLVAGRSRNDAVVVGASKASAALSADLLGLLANSGMLPPAPFVWRAERDWRAAWAILFAMMNEAGIDEPRFTEELERRLAYGAATDVRLVELGPDAAPLEAAA
jgi:hypothetical protein